MGWLYLDWRGDYCITESYNNLIVLIIPHQESRYGRDNCDVGLTTSKSKSQTIRFHIHNEK